MSNIHARGTPPAQAAERLAVLAGAMLAQGTSGVGLDLSKLTDEELKEYMRLRRKALIEAEEPDPQTTKLSPSY